MLRSTFAVFSLAALYSGAEASPVPNLVCVNKEKSFEFHVNYLHNAILDSGIRVSEKYISMSCDFTETGFSCVEDGPEGGGLAVQTDGFSAVLMQQHPFPLPPAVVDTLNCYSQV